MKSAKRRARLATAAVGVTVAVGAAMAPVTAAAGPPAVPTAQDGVAGTPPMGWNSWNSFGCDIDERLIRDTADALVGSGMRDAGYQYVVVDDCWFDPQRDPQGNLRANPERFPGGIRALADYVHSRGLKFGIYQVPTEKTCAQRGGTYPGATGSLGHEEQDARTFAEWGVDYLKYDWCSPEGTLEDQIAAFTKMRDALAATGRPIVYSINSNSYHPDKNGATHDWSPVANMWRTTEDIKPVWDSGNENEYPMGVVNIVEVNRGLAAQARPGHWNDPDMLEVGVYDVEGFKGLTDTEARAHLSMWAMMASPLIAGNNVTRMPDGIRDILTNREVVAVDQDPAGAQGVPVRDHGDREVWVKSMADGSRAVALFNRGERHAGIRTTAREAGLPEAPGYQVRDLWAHEDSTTDGEIRAEVPAHGVVLLRVSARG
ncbi:glycoside hydrolase family 27 protein [Saccharopolyspora erythraea]|uniref:glycoside hydrolase family 27 protein n=1 Tax=Saccharopolyspora erythraea TaxID=1836 RepID=UPI002011D7C6|nr:glycoside hydrolase family 27 protein [Saccharopolyspora erythraea]